VELARRERHPAGMSGLATAPASVGGLRRVTDVAGLSALYDRTAHLILWARPVDRQLARFAAEVLAANDLRSENEVEVADVEAFDPLPADVRSAAPAAAAAFAADVRELCAVFGELTGARRLGVRLVRLHGPMCPRFHTDHVGVRLLTTYHGVGTEWLAAEHVDRGFLGHRSEGRPDERSGLLRPGAVVHRMPEFAVALLKGEAWPGQTGFGVVHRSPSTQAPRVLLSIDVLAQEDAAEPCRGACGDDACGGDR